MDCSDDTGNTALHYAVAQGHYDVAAYLVYHGAYVDGRNIEGTTPLHFALEIQDENMALRMADLLMIRGSNAFIKDVHGVSPFDMSRNRQLQLLDLDDRMILRVTMLMFHRL